MKNPTNTPINNNNVAHLHPFIQISPSKRLFTLVSLLHLLAMLSFLSAGLALVWAQIPLFLLSIHLGVYWHRWRCSPVYLLRCFHQQWYLLPILKAGAVTNRVTKSTKKLSVIGCYYWSCSLVILIVEDDSPCKCYIPVMPDSSKDFRRIKILSKTMLDSSIGEFVASDNNTGKQ